MTPITSRLIFLALFVVLVPAPVQAVELQPPEQEPEERTAVSTGPEDRVVPFKQGIGGQSVFHSVTLSQDILNCKHDGIVVSADNVVLDCGGHTISGAGSGHGVKCVDCSQVTIRNCVIRNFEKGIYLGATDRLNPELSADNVIIDNTLTGNEHGVFLMWSHRTRIAGNKIVANTDSGISLTGPPGTSGSCSDHTTISSNAISHNRRGLLTFCSYKPQQGNHVEGNTFAHNVVSVTDRFEDEKRIRYRLNTFEDNLNTVFFRFEGDHLLERGAVRPFNVAVHGSDGEPCSDFVIKRVETSPVETVSYSKEGNRIRGRFTPRRDGLYSLDLAIQGCEQESIDQRYWFGTEKTKTLYLAKGSRRDAGRLVSEPPDESVYVYCTMWIEANVQEAPVEKGIAKITKVSSSMWSNYVSFQSGSVYSNVCAVEFDHTYSRRGDAFVAIDGLYEDGRANVTAEFNKGYFLYDRSDWSNLAVKYWGRDPDWISEPEATSEVTVHYLVTDSPVIDSISNRDAQLVSATTSRKPGRRSEIVLEGRGQTDVAIRVRDSKRPYKVSLDGVSCDRRPACRYTREANVIRLGIELVPGRQHTIAVEQEEPRKESS